MTWQEGERSGWWGGGGQEDISRGVRGRNNRGGDLYLDDIKGVDFVFDIVFVGFRGRVSLFTAAELVLLHS